MDSTAEGTKNVTTVIISAFCNSVVSELLLPWNRHELRCPTAASDGQIMSQTSSSQSGGSLDYTSLFFDNLLDTFGYNNRTLGIEISDSFQTWICTIAAASLVGLSGVIPLAILPLDMQHNRGNVKTLRRLLGFAVGGLLGDVFLHLLPEAWDHAAKAGPDGARQHQMWLGLWVLVGLFLFTICEMIFSASKQEKPPEEFVEKTLSKQPNHHDVHQNGVILQPQDKASEQNGDVYKKNGFRTDCYAHLNGATPSVIEATSVNNNAELYSISKELNGKASQMKKRSHTKNNLETTATRLQCNNDVHEKSCYMNGAILNRTSYKDGDNQWISKANNKENASWNEERATTVGNEVCKVTGYLNLLANSVDNFTHGLAVAASFLVSIKMGVLTTLAILIHEVPHEVGDYAILLRSGFTRWDAAKAQLSTASIGVIGAVVTLLVGSAETLGDRTRWILPFTAGGFLNIALVNLLPELLKEENPWESVKQMFCILLGIGVMLLVNLVTE